jgi:tol-pal system protein YbgF
MSADRAVALVCRRKTLQRPVVRRSGWASAVLGAALFIGIAAPATAGLFDDDEARRAIIDLRAKVEQAEQQQRTRQAAVDQQTQQLAEQTALVRRSLLELNTAIEQLRAELARMRGENEQLAREVAELQRKQRDMLAGVDDRIRRLEPIKVTVDGKEFQADPEEKRQFDEAMAVFRGGDFAAASNAFMAFNRRYPGSGYKESSLFWLGNAQYGTKQYREAITSFRALLAMAPNHPRAPEAMLSIANTNLELKDRAAARTAFNDLIKTYPQSEAAAVAKERVASLR